MHIMKGHMKKHQFWSGNRKSKRRAWSRALLITSGEKLSGEDILYWAGNKIQMLRLMIGGFIK